MRKSVLTGLLACTLVFMGNSAQAEAAPVSILQTKEELPVLELISSISGELHEFTPVAEVVNTDNDEPTELPEPVKHVVNREETLIDIAREYDVQWQRIFDKNMTLTNPDIIPAGVELIIPEPDEELESREIVEPEPVVEPTSRNRSQTSSASTAASTTTTSSETRPTTNRQSSSANYYVAGQCTWYAKNRRPDLPNNLGNARTWYQRAQAQGMPTGQAARAGAIGQWKGRNHVVYIESVNGDGTVTVTDMNWSGPYAITRRTVPATDFNYIY